MALAFDGESHLGEGREGMIIRSALECRFRAAGYRLTGELEK